MSPANCPECGGKTRRGPQNRVVCESCGLALTRKEMEELRSKLRKQMDLYNDEKQQDTKYRRKKRRNKEYLDWWTSEHED